jgi:hypothetical protein
VFRPLKKILFWFLGAKNDFISYNFSADGKNIGMTQPLSLASLSNHSIIFFQNCFVSLFQKIKTFSSTLALFTPTTPLREWLSLIKLFEGFIHGFLMNW